MTDQIQILRDRNLIDPEQNGIIHKADIQVW